MEKGMKISMIAAIGRNRELGEGNRLIWNIPSDLQRFRDITRGHPVIMGRRTHESIGRVLPDRANIIVTRDPQYQVPGAIVVNSIEQAIEEAKKNIHNTEYLIPDTEDEVFIIGGGQIYELGLPYANKLYLTKIDAEAKDADTFFPDYSEFKRIVKRESKEENGLKYEFIDLERG